MANWLTRQPDTKELSIGCFGARTGAGAALVTVAQLRETVNTVVLRGGRPDLADAYLPRVRAPTLLIVGGNDQPVIRMNRDAFNQLSCEKELVIVPATHLFEEPGALDTVAELARQWFVVHLPQRDARVGRENRFGKRPDGTASGARSAR